MRTFNIELTAQQLDTLVTAVLYTNNHLIDINEQLSTRHYDNKHMIKTCTKDEFENLLEAVGKTYTEMISALYNKHCK